MNILSWPGNTGGATDRPDRPGRARAGRKAVAIAALATVILPVVGTSNAMADIVTENTKKLVDAGPVNTANGYPAWYEDAGDCVAQCDRYLGDSRERERIRAAGEHFVRAHHTYDQRITNLLSGEAWTNPLSRS